MKRLMYAVAAAATGALAACGTTVPSAQQPVAGVAAGAPTGDGLSGPAATATGQSGSVPTTPVGAGSAGVPPTASHVIGSEEASPPPGTLDPQTGTSAGHGPVEVGIEYVANGGAALAAVGAANGSIDQKQAYAVLVKQLNARGGLMGHEIRPVWGPIDATSSTDTNTQQQRNCSTFTEDHHVVAVIALGLEPLVPCVTGRGVPVISGDPEDFNTSGFYSRYPLFASASAPILDAATRATVTAAARTDFFTRRWDNGVAGCATRSAPVFGLVAWDTPDLRAVYRDVLVPELRARGVSITDATWINAAGGVEQQIATIISASQNAVLRFASDCVDHVLFLDNNSIATIFLVEASQQHFHPRYAMNTTSGPELIVPNLSDPSYELRGLVGAGWSPYVDIAPSKYDAASKKLSASCIRTLRHGGIAIGDATQHYYAVWMCSSVAGLTIAARAAPEVTPPGLARGLTAAGPFRVPATFAATWSATHRAAATTARSLRFDPSCSCHAYGSDVPLR